MPTTLGDALRLMRENTPNADGVPMTQRELGRKANVSHTQIARIESGEVKKPAPEILQAISRVLDCNPRPLLIMAGRISGADARAELAPMFRDGAELVEEWGDWSQFTVVEARRLLADPNSSDEDLQRLAADVLYIRESNETFWAPEDEALVRGQGQGELRMLIHAWRHIGEPSRARLLEYARALNRLEDLELLAEWDAVRFETASIVPESSEPAAFDEQFLATEGFEGFLRILGLPSGCPGVPAAPGVYAVIRRAQSTPGFLEASAGGHFKGKDPSVGSEHLTEKWIAGATTVYIGRASSLQQRLNLLARFGRGEPVAHWGGRYLWQLEDHRDLLVAWQETTAQVDREAALVEQFVDAFGALPFANINQPRGESLP